MAKETPTHEELLARAVALRPLLRTNAGRAEAERRIPPENLNAMEEAGIFRMLVPPACGGYGSAVRTYVDVTAEIARGCGASGWLVFIDDATDWLVAQFPEAVQHEIYATGPAARSGGIFDAANARSEAAEGGLTVSGQWGFGSGVHHATWAALAVPLPGGEPGPKGEGLVLIPINELTIKDTWHVAGMRGTGSDTLIADKVFVPTRRIMKWGPVFDGYYPPHVSNSVFHVPFIPSVILMAVPPVLGLAQAALDVTLERLGAGKKISYTSYTDARLAPTTQLAVAEAATLTNAAFLTVRSWADRLDAAGLKNIDFDYLTRAQVRMDVGFAVQCCRKAVDILLNVQGASSFAQSNPLQRIWRDLSTASRHAILSPEIAQEIYGRALLGVENTITPLV